MTQLARKSIGISAIAAYEPSWVLTNDWFGAAMARKFVHHTGIEARGVSAHDEVEMAKAAVESLQRRTACDLRDCRGVVFVSPSFVPMDVANKYLAVPDAKRERLGRAARQLTRKLGIPDCPSYGVNWFCSGYARALAAVRRRFVLESTLEPNEFVLVVVSSRISRITDYEAAQSAPLFGDMATATMLSRIDSTKYPVHFRLKFAFAQTQPAPGVFFDFELRENVLVPAELGGGRRVPQRVVYRLDGMGIADTAPRAMSSAVEKALEVTREKPERIRFVVPHQAGTAIVRLAGMKLDQLGVRGELINGMTSRIGNVSACSIPYALHQHWSRLEGLIACPTAAVGNPGKAEVSRGCVLLESTPFHRRMAIAS